MQNTNFVILGISKNLFRKTISKFAPKIPISSNMSTLLYLFQYIFSILDFTQVRDFCAAYSILEPHDQINQAFKVPFQNIAKGQFINDDSSQIFLQKILLKKHFRCKKKKDSLTCDEEEA